VDRKTAAAISLTVLLWASAFAGIRAGLSSYSPENLALLRYLVASAALAVYALRARLPLPPRRDLLQIALAGFFGFTLYNILLNAGEIKIPAGTASLMIASAPIFVALLASLFFHEQLRLTGWVGILLSFLGVGLISVEPGQSLGFSSYALMVLGAALAQALYSILQKPLLRKFSPLQVTAYAVWAGTLFLAVFMPGLYREVRSAAPGATLAVIYMGLFPGALGYLCWSYALSRLPASQAGSYLYLVPVAAIAIAWVWLGEVPASRAVLGGLLVLLGVGLVNLLGRHRQARAQNQKAPGAYPVPLAASEGDSPVRDTKP
jgi:drug/metabolite transporter (DMT)-like permease